MFTLKGDILEKWGARGAVIPLNLLRGYTDPSPGISDCINKGR